MPHRPCHDFFLYFCVCTILLHKYIDEKLAQERCRAEKVRGLLNNVQIYFIAFFVDTAARLGDRAATKAY